MSSFEYSISSTAMLDSVALTVSSETLISIGLRHLGQRCLWEYSDMKHMKCNICLQGNLAYVCIKVTSLRQIQQIILSGESTPLTRSCGACSNIILKAIRASSKSESILKESLNCIFF